MANPKINAEQIDVGTGANQIVQLNGSGNMPAVDGSALTNISIPTTVVTWSSLDNTYAAGGTYEIQSHQVSGAIAGYPYTKEAETAFSIGRAGTCTIRALCKNTSDSQPMIARIYINDVWEGTTTLTFNNTADYIDVVVSGLARGDEVSLYMHDQSLSGTFGYTARISMLGTLAELDPFTASSTVPALALTTI